MKYYKQIITVMSLLVFLFSACEPRIEFDEGQWGDNAFITDVLVFIVQEEDHQLQEYYENGELTTGIRRQFINTSSEISEESASITVHVPSGTDLSNVGIVIRHTAKRIEPLSGSPVPGYLNNLSGGGPYTYRIVSADGTVRDWTVSFVVD